MNALLILHTCEDCGEPIPENTGSYIDLGDVKMYYCDEHWAALVEGY